mmetsp:Transcript_64656/g.181925  ORF Transcript_64656/g.181925 Transcript_64656/m.181925 type:complete len:210 (-) Transcript_64656:154-783(-)
MGRRGRGRGREPHQLPRVLPALGHVGVDAARAGDLRPSHAELGPHQEARGGPREVRGPRARGRWWHAGEARGHGRQQGWGSVHALQQPEHRPVGDRQEPLEQLLQLRPPVAAAGDVAFHNAEAPVCVARALQAAFGLLLDAAPGQRPRPRPQAALRKPSVRDPWPAPGCRGHGCGGAAGREVAVSAEGRCRRQSGRGGDIRLLPADAAK